MSYEKLPPWRRSGRCKSGLSASLTYDNFDASVVRRSLAITELKWREVAAADFADFLRRRLSSGTFAPSKMTGLVRALAVLTHSGMAAPIEAKHGSTFAGSEKKD